MALEIATHVATGLDAIHKQRLVHRDIKPSNIMVNFEQAGDVTAKIVDFGLARPAGDVQTTEAAISITQAEGTGALDANLPWHSILSTSS